MSVAIALTLYAVAFWVLLQAVEIASHGSSESLLAAQVVGFALFLFVPLAVFSFIASRLTARSVTQIGHRWCEEHAETFVRVEMHKNHYTLVCINNGKKIRRKFQVELVPTTWMVRSVHWL